MTDEQKLRRQARLDSHIHALEVARDDAGGAIVYCICGGFSERRKDADDLLLKVNGGALRKYPRLAIR